MNTPVSPVADGFAPPSWPRSTAEQRLRLAVAAAELALVELDLARDQAWLSAEAARLLGLGTEPAAVPRAALQAVLHPDDRAQVLAQMARCLAPGGPDGFELAHRILPPGGGERWLRMRGQLLFEPEGGAPRPVGVLLVLRDATAEHEAAAARQRAGDAARAHLRALLDALPQQVVVLDGRGVVREVNVAWEDSVRANGGTVEALGPGLDYLAVCRRAAQGGDAHAMTVLAALQELLDGRREQCVLEYPCPTPQGDARWFVMRARRLRDGAGVVVYHMDVSGRRRSEDRLRESLAAQALNEQRLHLAMDAARLISFEWDIQRDEVRRLRSLHDCLPDTPPDAPERFADMLALVHPEDRGAFEARVRAALAQPQERYESEFRLQGPDGRVIWLQDLGRVECDAAGRPRRLLGMSQDVTARKATEMRLAEQTALLDTLSAQAPLGMAFVDAAFRYVRINDKLAAMNGLDAAAHLGRPVHEVVPQLWPSLQGPYRRALAGEVVMGDEVSGQTPAAPGETRWWSATYYPVRVDGRTLGVGVVVQDVTARRQAEVALREADRHKDAFLATLAHELRNPLAPLRHALETLRRTGGDAASRARALATMARQLAHMVRLIDDLLDVSRISRDRLELRCERVRLDAALDAAIETCRPLLERGGHALALALPAQPLWLFADPVRLAQVFGNLLANACKYTEPGGRIRLAAEPCGPRSVRVRVSDTGLGIPGDMLERVFELFTQVPVTQARAAGGLGIGLSLVRRLVELHGGSVVAHSEGPSRGSEFVVELPLLQEPGLPGDVPVHGPGATADTAVNNLRVQSSLSGALPHPSAPAVTEPQTPAAAPTAAPAMLESPDLPSAAVTVSEGPLHGSATPRGRRILIVDDNADSADSLAMLLQLGGHEAHTAYDGPQGLEAAARLQPEVMLLDLGLPGLDGCELCRRIRQQPWGQDALLIAVTGWGQAADRQRSRDAGFDAHLVKPVELAALEQVIGGLAGQAPRG